MIIRLDTIYKVYDEYYDYSETITNNIQVDEDYFVDWWDEDSNYTYIKSSAKGAFVVSGSPTEWRTKIESEFKSSDDTDDVNKAIALLINCGYMVTKI